MKFTALFILATVVSGTYALCPVNIVNAIKTYWNGSPPKDIIKTLQGSTVTWLTNAPFLGKDPTRVNCFRSSINDVAPYADIVTYTNAIYPVTGFFRQVIEQPGVLSLKGIYPRDNRLVYVLALNSYIFVTYHCLDGRYAYYNGFTEIGVLGNATDIPNNDTLKREVDGAYALLCALDLPPLQDIKTNCD